MNRFELVNWYSIFVAALSGFLIGALWYGPICGKAWSRLSGVARDAVSRIGPVATFGGAYVLNLIAATGIALQNGSHTGIAFALHIGLMGAVFFIAPALGVIYLFEQRPFLHWLVNAGYQVVNFSVMGAIIGAWPR